MILQSLQIDDFRNISSIKLAFSKKFNAFYGVNGAGKTSLLEAIYVLATAKSFRSSQSEVIISHQKENFMLFSVLDDGVTTFPVGIRRNRYGALSVHLRSEAIRSIAEVSQLLPVLFIGSDSHRILTDGPKARRQFLDWGLFHVKHDFLTCWRTYQKLLTHRNAALKARVSREELGVWDQQLANTGEILHNHRIAYVDSFLPYFVEMLEVFFQTSSIRVDYFSGWAGDVSLLTSLSNEYHKAMAVGHTLSGPHRADLLITVDGLPADEICSQGQQKLISYALRLAQGVHLKSMDQKAPIFLIDDLPSELDIENQARVAEILQKLDAQVFVTGIHEEDLTRLLIGATDSIMFHVKQGAVVL